MFAIGCTNVKKDPALFPPRMNAFVACVKVKSNVFTTESSNVVSAAIYKINCAIVSSNSIQNLFKK